MRKAERQNYILETLFQKSFIDVTEIQQHCRVSPITARRDLDELAERELLLRTHGGAIKKETAQNLHQISESLSSNIEQKIKISKLAANFIENHDAVLLDSGTTVYHLCRFIKEKTNLQVITNSLPVASELLKSPEIKVFLIGGEVFQDRMATYGPIASEHIAQYHVKKAFIGTDGISLQRGLTVRDVNEATRIKAMIDAADEVYLLCDSSKIESNSLFKLAPLSAVNYLVTDGGIKNEVAKKYRKSGINVFIAD